jgi:hypothetical protein
MKAQLKATAKAVTTIELLRLESQPRPRELSECRRRIRRMEGFSAHMKGGCYEEGRGLHYLCGSEFGETRHICACFHSDEEAYRVLLPFVKGGIQCRDKAVHVVNPDQRSAHVRRLTAAGVDTAAAQQTGQPELKTNTEVCLRDGRSDQDWTLRMFGQLASVTANRGFPLRRIFCHVNWAAEAHWHIDNLVEFKSLVNDGANVLLGGEF